jgi:DNA mismatch endonuclease (patch repair protein)
MAAVRSKDTLPELQLRHQLFALGARGWRCHYLRAAGRPDISWPALRVAVFVDGAFWHGHPSRFRPGRSGSYWDSKIARNMERDRQVGTALDERGWAVARVWDFEVRSNPSGEARKILSLLAEQAKTVDVWPEWLRRYTSDGLA